MSGKTETILVAGDDADDLEKLAIRLQAEKSLLPSLRPFGIQRILTLQVRTIARSAMISMLNQRGLLKSQRWSIKRGGLWRASCDLTYFV